MSSMFLRSRRFLRQKAVSICKHHMNVLFGVTDLDDVYSATVDLAIDQPIAVKIIVVDVDFGQLVLSYCLQKL